MHSDARASLRKTTQWVTLVVTPPDHPPGIQHHFQSHQLRMKGRDDRVFLSACLNVLVAQRWRTVNLSNDAE